MYSIVVTNERVSVDIPFFGKSSPEATALMEQFRQLEKQAPGFIDTVTTLSTDKLAMSVVHNWDTKADFENFRNANATFLASLKEARTAYNDDHGVNRIFEQSSDVQTVKSRVHKVKNKK